MPGALMPWASDGSGTTTVRAVSAAPATAVIVLGDPLGDLPADFAADADLVVYLGTVASPALAHADFLLPLTSFAEQEGTFTNFEGRVQRFWPALNPAPHGPAGVAGPGRRPGRAGGRGGPRHRG
jgi:NADH dehydrogenase/NADH:ubiquinone oxidoreductase subunit G